MFYDAETNPATGEPFNRVRAEWARDAVNAFARETFNGRSFDEILAADGLDSDAPDVIADLITDALHLARLSGMDATALAAQGVSNFEDEEENEADAQAEAEDEGEEAAQ